MGKGQREAVGLRSNVVGPIRYLLSPAPSDNAVSRASARARTLKSRKRSIYREDQSFRVLGLHTNGTRLHVILLSWRALIDSIRGRGREWGEVMGRVGGGRGGAGRSTAAE